MEMHFLYVLFATVKTKLEALAMKNIKLMALILALGTLWGCAGSPPQKPTLNPDDYEVSKVSDEVFSSELSAVVSAGRSFIDDSLVNNVEYMGAIIYTPSGQYRYTVSKNSTGEDRVTVKIRIPEGYKISAFWHTHGRIHRRNKYFSDVDTNLSNTTGKPVYLITPKKLVRVFTPGGVTLPSLKSKRKGLGSTSGYSKGTLLGVLSRLRE